MVADFKDIKKEDVSVAGGKGANLGEMTREKINVPAGFIVTTEAYKEFLRVNKITDIINNELNKAGNDEKSILNAACYFRKRIRSGTFPAALKNLIGEKYNALGENKKVAIRSSATAEDLADASFAGQQDSYLNIQGMDEILEHIRSCYASLWTDRAVSYRFRQGYDQSRVSIAVIVQEMVESEKSGVLFTVAPINKNENAMLINAAFGLGESVVSGRVSADTYMIDKKTGMIQINIGNKETQIVYDKKGTVERVLSDDKRKSRVLNDSEISKLRENGLKIEKHYNMPMDIEWAVKDGKVYILQARAITTLNKKTDDTDEENELSQYIKGKKINKSTRKALGFILEKMPFAYRTLDFCYLEAINDQKANILSEGGIVIAKNPLIDDDGIQSFSDTGIHFNKNIFNFFKVLKTVKDFDYCYERCLDFMEKYESEIERIKTLEFENMTLSQCKKFIIESYDLLSSLAYDRFKYALFPSVLRSKGLDKIIKKADPSYASFDFYSGLNNKTSTVNSDISTLAREIRKNTELRDLVTAGESYNKLYENYDEFRLSADRFMKDNGYRSDFNCYCLAARTFMEDPDRLLKILIPILKEDEESTVRTVKKDFLKIMQKLEKIYGVKYKKTEKQIYRFRYFHVVREETQYMWETLFFYIRQCVKRINFILLGNEDIDSGVANLFYKELLEVLEKGALSESDKEKINRRNSKYPLAVKVWEASKTLVFKCEGDVLKGVSASGGTAVARVCVINDPGEFYKMKKGDILLCHYTDPEWTPLFKLASAVVSDTGSELSHAAIVAREYNIPAVLGVGLASLKFKDGDRIQVDGDKGLVKRL